MISWSAARSYTSFVHFPFSDLPPPPLLTYSPFQLFGAQRQLAMGPTRPLISRVITLTMETTVLTTMAATVSAVLSATLPQTRFHFMMCVVGFI